jgi:hypothetical protein
MGVSADFESERLSEHPLERRRMPCGRPEFQFGVPRGAELEQSVLSAVVQLDAGDGLGVAAIEALRQAQHRRQRPYDPPALPGQLCEPDMAALRRGVPVIARDEREDLDLSWLEAAQVAVANQVVRVFVVPLVADVHADVVEQCRVLEPLAFAIGQGVRAARLFEQ